MRGNSTASSRLLHRARLRLAGVAATVAVLCGPGLVATAPALPATGSQQAVAAAGFSGSISTVTAADLPSSYRAGCPVGPADLRLLRLRHHGFDGAVRDGELVVHTDSAHRLLRVFSRLYDLGFPIERMQRVDAFGGSDDASMAANNTSAFNCRPVAGGTGWSEHAYGRAVDLNPVQNPYVRDSTVLPPAGRAYLDRSWWRPGMVLAGDEVVRAFASQGWGWGGYWTRPRDYQHFFAGTDGRRPAAPDPGTPPFGTVDAVTSSGNTVRVSGWAVDADRPWESISVALYVDGFGVAWYPTDVVRPDVNAALGVSGSHGFSFEARLPDGVRELTVYGINVGPDAGSHPVLAVRNHHVNPGVPPTGRIDVVSSSGGQVRVAGWALDGDRPTTSIAVALYVDGGGISWFPTDVPRPDVNAAFGVTGSHGFDIRVPVPAGAHRFEVYGIAVGPDAGYNPLLDARTVAVGP